MGCAIRFTLEAYGFTTSMTCGECVGGGAVFASTISSVHVVKHVCSFSQAAAAIDVVFAFAQRVVCGWQRTLVINWFAVREIKIYFEMLNTRGMFSAL